MKSKVALLLFLGAAMVTSDAFARTTRIKVELCEALPLRVSVKSFQNILVLRGADYRALVAESTKSESLKSGVGMPALVTGGVLSVLLMNPLPMLIAIPGGFAALEGNEERLARTMAPIQSVVADSLNGVLSCSKTTSITGLIDEKKLTGKVGDSLEFLSDYPGVYRVGGFVTESPDFGPLKFELTQGHEAYQTSVAGTVRDGKKYTVEIAGPFTKEPISANAENVAALWSKFGPK